MTPLADLSRHHDLISVVSPVYNEQDNLEPFYAAVIDATRNADFDIEIILVNDGSRDRSEEILKELASSDPRVKAICLSRNFGALAACNAGLRVAQGSAVVLMSSDLQDPPSLIPRFVEGWRQGHDIVWAVRETRADPPLKRLFARAFYGIIRILAFPDYPENGMDCGLFSRRVMDIYNLLPERDLNPVIMIFSLGFSQLRISYDRMSRLHGTSSWTFWRRVKGCLDIVSTFSYTPLRLISATGVIFSTLAVLYGTFLVVRRLVFDQGSEGWTSLAVLTLFIGGVLSLFIGIIAEYVWRIGENTRQRPRYVIARRYEARPNIPVSPKKLDTLHIDVSGMGRKPIAPAGNEVVRQPHADGPSQAAE